MNNCIINSSNYLKNQNYRRRNSKDVNSWVYGNLIETDGCKYKDSVHFLNDSFSNLRQKLTFETIDKDNTIPYEFSGCATTKNKRIYGYLDDFLDIPTSIWNQSKENTQLESNYRSLTETGFSNLRNNSLSRRAYKPIDLQDDHPFSNILIKYYCKFYQNLVINYFS